MEQQFIVTTIRAIKNQQKLTIKQLFQAFWNTILGPKYKQFLNHYVSEELNDRKKS